jgi:hypothetical protein
MFDEFDDNQRREQPDASGEESGTTAPHLTGAEAPGMQNASTRTRYRDAAMSWLALGALLAAWHMEARLERPVVAGSRLAAVRDGSRFANQLWLSGTSRARSWIERAAAATAARTADAFGTVGSVASEQPDWSAIASVRTAKRWLGSRED